MCLQVQKKRGKSNAKEEHLPTFSTNERRCVTAPFGHVHSVVEFLLPCCDCRPALAARSQGAQPVRLVFHPNIGTHLKEFRKAIPRIYSSQQVVGQSCGWKMR